MLNKIELHPNLKHKINIVKIAKHHKSHHLDSVTIYQINLIPILEEVKCIKINNN